MLLQSKSFFPSFASLCSEISGEGKKRHLYLLTQGKPLATSRTTRKSDLVLTYTTSLSTLLTSVNPISLLLHKTGSVRDRVLRSRSGTRRDRSGFKALVLRFTGGRRRACWCTTLPTQSRLSIWTAGAKSSCIRCVIRSFTFTTVVVAAVKSFLFFMLHMTVA